MDADQLGMMQVFCEGYDLSENGQAMDAMREVGPGSHYLGCAHTQANFETAFYRSSIADNNSFEQWEAEGAKDAKSGDAKPGDAKSGEAKSGDAKSGDATAEDAAPSSDQPDGAGASDKTPADSEPSDEVPWPLSPDARP